MQTETTPGPWMMSKFELYAKGPEKVDSEEAASKA